MTTLVRTGALLAASALAVTAAASAPAAASGTSKIASLRGSASVLFPPMPGDDVRFTVDAHARYGSGGSPFPVDSWGTARLSHRFTGERPGLIWYTIKVDCLMTGGNTATVTGVITDAAPDGRSEVGKRLGFSVNDRGRQDLVGFSGLPLPGDPPLTKCMAPASYFTLKDGGYKVVDAEHWL